MNESEDLNEVFAEGETSTQRLPVRELVNATILVVDDEDDIRQLLCVFLRRQRCRAIPAADGQEALEILRKKPVDVVITDVLMPRLGGMELLAAIRQEWPEIPVIIITGRPVVEAAVECMRNGAFDYLSKPFDFRKIRELIEGAVAQRREVGDRGLASGESFVNLNHRRFFGNYRVLDLIGEGNIGIVFLTENADEQEENKYALKVLKPNFIEGSQEGTLADRFLREAQACSLVRHPNVIRVAEYGITNDERIPYIVMEYFPAPSLKHYVKNPHLLDYRQKAHVIRQLADALTAIHERGITHRDIKPGNVLVSEDLHVKLTDFGIARLPGSDLTLDSELLGSPAYLSPEAFESPRVTPQSDIFSLGVLAYELLLGQKPFLGDSIPSFARSVQKTRPIEPRQLDPEFPPELQHILAHMLKKNVQDRYKRARDVVHVLDAWLEDRYHGEVGGGLFGSITRHFARDWR